MLTATTTHQRLLAWVEEAVQLCQPASVHWCEGTGKAVETPIGYVPAANPLDVTGLSVNGTDLGALLAVDLAGWRKEALDVAENYKKFGPRLPAALEKELFNLDARLSAATLGHPSTANNAG